MILRPRHGLFLLAFAASLAIGTALVFRLIRPQTIAMVGTHELVAILGLLVLPAAAGWAFLSDGRRRGRTDATRPAESPAGAPIAGVPAARGPARLRRAHRRRTLRHRGTPCRPRSGTPRNDRSA